MSQNDKFRRVHDDLLDISSAISNKLTPPFLASKAYQVRSLLALLADKLSVHLAMEHNVLSSLDVASGEGENDVPSVSMEDIADSFCGHVGSWPTCAAIMTDARRFIHETHKVLAELIARIGREPFGSPALDGNL